MGITAAGLAADPNAQRSLARLNAAVKSKDNWFGVLLDQIRTYTSPLQLAASEIKDKNLTKAALSEELVGRGAASYYTGGLSENAFNLAERPTSTIGTKLTGSPAGGIAFSAGASVAGVAGGFSGDSVFSSTIPGTEGSVTVAAAQIGNIARSAIAAATAPDETPRADTLYPGNVYTLPTVNVADLRDLLARVELTDAATIDAALTGRSGGNGGARPGQTSPRARSATPAIGIAVLAALVLIVAAGRI